jgi:hypothetical protein
VSERGEAMTQRESGAYWLTIGVGPQLPETDGATRA